MKMHKTILATALALAGLSLVPFAIAAEAPAATPPSQSMASEMNWFGGHTYNGAPALEVTAALVKAGGGAEHFTCAKSLVSMLGQKTVAAELAKLNSQYGKAKVDAFLDGMTFAVKDGLRRATKAGVTLPPAPPGLHGAKLAKTLVRAGTAPDGRFWAGYLFDHALSHDIHVQVMQDIDARFGHAADQNTHKILNQAMYDVAQALKMNSVKLASLH
ncbi:MAG TPA: hypothetical protein VFG73_11230 [Rhodanobacteraceae bacterium]|nr:hypothetical protein [Rhodanobacteraceae bacterium]